MDTRIINLDLLRSYILKLTDQDIYELEEIMLTSAQKARVASWCDANNIETPDLNNNSFWKESINVKENPAPQKEFNSRNFSNLLSGVDIQKIAEFLPDIEKFSKNDKNLLSIFTKSEISYAESKSYTRETLAGIFAAKEAVFKCNNMQKRNWSDIELKYNNGKPEYKGYAISISHSGEYAIATAIKEIQPYDQKTIISELKDRINLNNFDKKLSKRFYEYIIILGSLGGLLFLINTILNYLVKS
jgi:phosphopantetheine--protein transferase-like protein